MDAVSAISETPYFVKKEPFSNHIFFSLPLEVFFEIFSWLSFRDRHELHQNPLLKKRIELVDQYPWKPFQKFINQLSECIEGVAEEQLKEELSSFLTNLKALNNKEASFYEKHADFFVALFNLSPPAFNELLRYFGEDDPFIKEASTYRYFEPFAQAFTLPNRNLIGLAKTDHFFPIHKILPLLPPGPQGYYAANMISACWKNTMEGTPREEQLEERYGEELIFFTKKISEIIGMGGRINSETLSTYLITGFQCLIYYGWVNEARELADTDDVLKKAFWEAVRVCICLYDIDDKMENILALAEQLEYSDKISEVINNEMSIPSHRKEILGKITERRTVYCFRALLHKSP